MVKTNKPEKEALIAVAKEASEPIIAGLRDAGVEVGSLADLVNKNIDYRDAIPMLLSWLQKVENPDVKEMIIRAVGIKWVGPEAAAPLIEEFMKAPASEELGLKWAIANALSEVADKTAYEDIVGLVRDKRHGRAREMLAVAVGMLNGPGAVEVLIEMLHDQQVAGHALLALRKLAAPQARSAIEPFVDDPRAWIRKEARRALEKIDKKEARPGGNR